MSKRHVYRAPTAIALVALALAGCGGGSSSSSSSSSASSNSSSSSSVASAPAAASSTAVPSATSTHSVSAVAQAYAAKLVPLAKTWQAGAQHYASVVGGAGTQNLPLIASSSSAFAAATNEFADGIAALTPPPGAAAAQAQLVSAVRALGRDVQELQSAAEHRNLATANDAQRRVGPDGKAVSTAVLALAAAAERSGG